MPSRTCQIWSALLGASVLSVSIGTTVAQSDKYGFLNGSYIVIGRHPDSKEPYSGRVNLFEADGQLQVTRTVNGQKIVGSGNLEKALGGQTDVLRIRFSHDGKSYEATYVIGSDLDNYARLTGYVYLKDGSTKKVGLEALFSHHGQLKRD